MPLRYPTKIIRLLYRQLAAASVISFFNRAAVDSISGAFPLFPYGALIFAMGLRQRHLRWKELICGKK